VLPEVQTEFGVQGKGSPTRRSEGLAEGDMEWNAVAGKLGYHYDVGAIRLCLFCVESENIVDHA
jgi:hypothetical protein